MVQDIIWSADSNLACQKISFLYGTRSFVTPPPPMEPVLSQLWQRISPGPRRFETFHNNKHVFTVRGCQPHAKPPSWRTTRYRLSVTVYSLYSQQPSLTGRLTSNRKLRTCHAVVTRDPPNLDGVLHKNKNVYDIPLRNGLRAYFWA
jgi:hypothetical protein